MTITIITNNVPRDIVYGYELTREERADFDYIDWAAVDNGESSPEFVRYKGELLDISEFQTTTELSKGAGHHDLSAWDGYQSDSFFSGLCIRYPREGVGYIDFERVVVGRYMT